MYIQVDDDFPQHPKSERLCVVLSNVVAWAFMVRLWCWAAKYQHDGELGQYEPVEIEAYAGWPKRDGKFYAAAAKVGFIDEDEPGKPGRLHDWMDRTGADLARMKAEAERSRSRKRAWRERTRNADVPRDNDGTPVGQTGDGTWDIDGCPAADKTRQGKSKQDQDLSLSSLSSGSDPAGARSNAGAVNLAPIAPEQRRWAAEEWFEAYRVSWLTYYDSDSYGSQSVDRRGTEGMREVLRGLSLQDALSAQARSAAILAEYFTDRSEDLVRARHPWPWFVTRFNGLRVARRAASKPAVPSYQKLLPVTAKGAT